MSRGGGIGWDGEGFAATHLRRVPFYFFLSFFLFFSFTSPSMMTMTRKSGNDPLTDLPHFTFVHLFVPSPPFLSFRSPASFFSRLTPFLFPSLPVSLFLLLSGAEGWEGFFFSSSFFLPYDTSRLIKQEIGAELAREREINSPFVSRRTHPSSSPYSSSSFRCASFLHSARSCRQRSDQGWKLGPGGSAP